MSSPVDVVQGDEPIFVAVVGITGAGKSTFINLLTGSKLGVGKGLKSCTKEVVPSDPVFINTRKVFLFDTPGFDDKRGDDVILKEIADFLAVMHEDKKKIHGLIYLHRITDDRLGRSGEQTYNMITEMCGTQNFANVVVVTTRWERMIDEEDREHAKNLEEQLRTDEDFFRGLATGGASFMRHENTRATAEAIVQRIMKNHPVVFQIQTEMVDKKLDLLKTSAGKALEKEVKEDNEAIHASVEKWKAEMAEFGNLEEKKAELAKAKRELEYQTKELERGKEQLRRMQAVGSGAHLHKLPKYRAYEEEKKRKWCCIM